MNNMTHIKSKKPTVRLYTDNVNQLGGGD